MLSPVGLGEGGCVCVHGTEVPRLAILSPLGLCRPESAIRTMSVWNQPLGLFRGCLEFDLDGKSERT